MASNHLTMEGQVNELMLPRPSAMMTRNAMCRLPSRRAYAYAAAKLGSLAKILGSGSSGVSLTPTIDMLGS